MDAEVFHNVTQVIAVGQEVNPTMPFQRGEIKHSRGSGFFVAPGVVVTCHHVVRNAETVRLTVFREDGSTWTAKARVSRVFPDTDLAVLRVDPPGLKDRRGGDMPSGLGLVDDKALAMGDELRVLGFPLGGAEVKSSQCTFNGRAGTNLQIDGAVNPGNSGGPALSGGRVVGFVTSGIDKKVAQNMSFVVPASTMMALWSAIVGEPAPAPAPESPVRPPWEPARVRVGSSRPEPKLDVFFVVSAEPIPNAGPRGSRPSPAEVRRESAEAAGRVVVPSPSLCADFQNSSEALRRCYGNTCNRDGGVVVQWMSKRSPLRAAGFEIGDSLCWVELPGDGGGRIPVTERGAVNVPWNFGPLSLPALLNRVPLNAEFRVGGWSVRGRRPFEAAVSMSVARHGAYRSPVYPHDAIDYEAFGGAVVTELNANLLGIFGELDARLSRSAKERRCVVVSSVIPQTRFAEHWSIMPGTVLRFVNGASVRSLDEYRRALLKPVQSRFLTFEGRDAESVVLDLAETVSAEPELAKSFGYPLSATFRAFSASGVPAGPEDDDDSAAA